MEMYKLYGWQSKKLQEQFYYRRAGMRESSSEVSSGVQNAGQYAAISSRATKKSVAALPSGSARVM